MAAHGLTQAHQRLEIISIEIGLICLGVDRQQQHGRGIDDLEIDHASSISRSATGQRDADLPQTAAALDDIAERRLLIQASLEVVHLLPGAEVGRLAREGGRLEEHPAGEPFFVHGIMLALALAQQLGGGRFDERPNATFSQLRLFVSMSCDYF